MTRPTSSGKLFGGQLAHDFCFPIGRGGQVTAIPTATDSGTGTCACNRQRYATSQFANLSAVVQDCKCTASIEHQCLRQTRIIIRITRPGGEEAERCQLLFFYILGRGCR